MESQEKTAYVTEYNKRVLDAHAHTDAMFAKYQARAFEWGMDSSTPGFSYWKTKGHNDYGQVIWEHEYPLPYSTLYESFFLRMLYWAKRALIIPYLEEAFLGDIVDRDYIESLLVDLDEIGVSQVDKLIIAHDNSRPWPAGTTATVKDLLAHPELDSGAIIIGGPKLTARIATVRDWLQRKASQKSVTVPQTTPPETSAEILPPLGSVPIRQDYETILYQRQLEALAHDKEMIDKYCFMEHHNPDDISLWHGETEVEDSSGKKVLLFFPEFPKPHSPLYLQHFIRQIMQNDLDSVREWVKKEFENDIVDKDYVKKLLVEAENLGMNINDTMVIIHRGIINSYPPPSPGDSPYFYSQDYPKFINQDAFHGGKEFIRRAEILQEWCQEATSTHAYTANTISPHVVNNSNPSTRTPASGNITKKKDLLINQLTDTLNGILHFKIQANDVAELILNTLYNISKTNTTVDNPVILSNANARVFAIANALKLHKVITLPAPAIAARIGNALDIEIGKRLYSQSQTYNDCFEPLKDAVLSMKTKAQARA